MKLTKKTATILTLAVVIAAAGGGYYLWNSKSAKETGKEEKAAQGPVQYTCPMHPFIIKDKPGACPICGMTWCPSRRVVENSRRRRR